MTTFRVWAPDAKAVSVVLRDPAGPDPDSPDPDSPDPAGTDRTRELTAAAGGWFAVDDPAAGHGTDYAFLLDGSDTELPDPRSRWQPAGVHARSRVLVHDRFAWTDDAWRGLPLAGAVLYELHVGTFTAAGTFDGAIERLDHLVSLGVDAVELLPCAAFSGERGWGYDGVDLYAVHAPYGGPAGLKRFVDAAHARGVGVVMDVVYNHLGPDGNYLSRFGPYFTATHVTPWGDAVNLDAAGSDEVRAFLLGSALGWLRDYHLDGLRLDAVHAFADGRAVPLLEELSTAVDALSATVGRPLFLVAESDLNDPRLVLPREAGGLGVHAQWCDDVHHALWSALSGERQGYYVDFGPLPVLAKALEQAFVHDGDYSTFRGRSHGRPVPPSVPGSRFVTYLQDHDQIGNRALGDRSAAGLSEGLLRVGAALLLTVPYTPMLFMGEEWGASTPWRYFTSFTDPALADAVRNGRRAEFAAHGWAAEDVPDPQDPATFAASTLDWAELDAEPHAGLLDWHRKLVALRRSLALADPRRADVHCAHDDAASWFVMHRGDLAVVCNLGPARQAVPIQGTPYEILLASRTGFTFSPDGIDLDAESVVIARLLS